MKLKARQEQEWRRASLECRRAARGGGRRGPRGRGFTLIEMLIVVVVFGVLVSIAVPTYLNSIRKSRRTEAKSALLDLAAREERWYTINNTYVATGLQLGYTTNFPINLDTKPYYTMTVAQTASTYTLTATAENDQTNDACGNYTLDNYGNQTNSTSATGCW